MDLQTRSKSDTIAPYGRGALPLEQTAVNKTPGAAQGLMTIGTLYSYLYCMLASSVIVSLPILGGAMYLAGSIALILAALMRGSQHRVLSRSMRTTLILLLSLVLLGLFALITIFPIRLDSGDFWRLAGIVLCIVVRPLFTRYILERALIQNKKTMVILERVAGIQLMFLPLLLLLLLLPPLSRGTVWALVGGFALSGVLECFPLERMRQQLAPFSPEDQKEINALREVHAFRVFQWVALAVAAGVQVTQVMAYTYIAVTARALVVCMLIALMCTYAASWAASALLRRTIDGSSDPNFVLMAGLILWLYGLILFILSLDAHRAVVAYLSLALCTMGSTACVRVVAHMEEDMRRVAAFAIGRAPSGAVDRAQQIRIEYAALLGQMAALLGLTLITAFTANDFPDTWDQAFRAFSPLLTLPALALVTAAILCALLFPLTRQHLDKLKKYADLRKNGLDNPPLHDQLEAVVVKKSLKRYGIKIILFILRPLFYHRIRGKENLHLDEDIPCVFVCNHGEIYGPVVTNLYVPFSFRPWSTYEMLDQDAVARHTMDGAFRNVSGLWRKALGFFMEKIAAPALVWILKSVDAIPVYHDHPRKLMQTFRETIAAMEAGDNILVFPENAGTTADHRYAREGISPFFTGFVMIGQMYSAKTGKCPLFVPLYADRHRHTITFGTPIRYNDQINPNEEKELLCAQLREEILRMAGLENE